VQLPLEFDGHSAMDVEPLAVAAAD